MKTIAGAVLSLLSVLPPAAHAIECPEFFRLAAAAAARTPFNPLPDNGACRTSSGRLECEWKYTDENDRAEREYWQLVNSLNACFYARSEWTVREYSGIFENRWNDKLLRAPRQPFTTTKDDQMRTARHQFETYAFTGYIDTPGEVTPEGSDEYRFSVRLNLTEEGSHMRRRGRTDEASIKFTVRSGDDE